MSDAEPLRADFKNFLFLLWKHLGLPAPTDIQYQIADYLQHGPKRRCVQAFRGIGKSWITAAYVLWRLYCNPDEKVLVISASKDRSDAFSIFCKRLLLEISILKHLRPKEDQRQSNIAFDVGPAKAHQAPSVKSAGITGQITGSRATVIVADDVEVPNNSATQLMRDKLTEQVKEFEAILVPDGETDIIFLGTPQTEMTLYNELPARGYDIRIWPSRYPAPGDVMDVYLGRLAPEISDRSLNDPGAPGTPVEPSRFHEGELSERELSYGRSGFAMQFMLNPRISDTNRYPLKVNDLIVMAIHPDEAPQKLIWGREPDLVREDLPNIALPGDAFYRPMFRDKESAPFTGAVMTIDPAGRGRDETGYAVVKMLHGFLYLVAAGGHPGGFDRDTLLALSECAKKHRVNKVIIEKNFGDGMFTELLKPVMHTPRPEDNWPGYKVGLEEVHHVGQKELRIIDTLEPVMNQHRLIVDDRIIREDYENQNLSGGLENVRNYQLIHQLTRITRDRGALRHDDRIEAVAMAVGYWVEQMGIDNQVAVDRHQSRLLDAELKRFKAHVVGHPLKKPSPLSGRGRRSRYGFTNPGMSRRGKRR